MSDFFPSEPAPGANMAELTVSELAGSIKRTIESNFDRVRVRGELGRVTIAKSGHMYADLKDDKAVINTIMWKGSVSRLPFRPEEGLEVVAEGKLSTYPGRSNYQLIADTMNPAGAGALMALLEERKKKLAAEGLFETSRKQGLPFLPRAIGVVTSPTGAVIRDILHRLEDRFPVHVLVWPALVQGEQAAAQIEAGIRGFNALPVDGRVPRPDVIIVARGGGSIEDLWPFNEEIVVRAAADSAIPLISAVGHETDTTLIDYASDRRAPTPTGAAEIAVPVRSELVERTSLAGERLVRSLSQAVARQERELKAIAARLPRPESLLDLRQQRFDYAEGRLTTALQSAIFRKQAEFDRVVPRLRPETLKNHLQQLERDTVRAGQGLAGGLKRLSDVNATRLEGLSRRLSVRGQRLTDVSEPTRRVDALGDRLGRAVNRKLQDTEKQLARSSTMLEALSFHATLERGFAIVRDQSGQLVRSSDTAKSEPQLTVTFSDGDVQVSPGKNAPQTPRRKASDPPTEGGQGTLF